MKLRNTGDPHDTLRLVANRVGQDHQNMKKGSLAQEDLGKSVISVPPLARNPDLTLSRTENARIVSHLRSGGVSTFLYGGNANLYSQSVFEFGELLDLIEEHAADDEWVIPSIGPDYGKLIDQAKILAGRDFPTAMVLPTADLATPAGNELAIRHAAEKFGRPLLVYLKQESFLKVEQVTSLVRDGAVWAIKYAIPRDDVAKDDYLSALIDQVGSEIMVSGFGEQPAIVHMRDFRLQCYTSGCVCIAPTLSSRLLAAAKSGNWDEAEGIRYQFEPMENERDRIHPIRTLHDAMTLAGIANTGPILPPLSGIDASEHENVRSAASQLLGLEQTLREGTKRSSVGN